MNVEYMRKVPITELLTRLGHEPTARKGNEWWYSAPYRQERTPSFRVNIQKNVWQDFGIGRGGDIFSLAGEFTGSGDFRSQAEFVRKTLGGIMPETVFRPEVSRNEKPEEEECFAEVEFRPLLNRVLLGYLEERGIDSGVAIPNCVEVRYTTHGRRYFTIGFRNISGGYEIRNRLFKGSIAPKDISLVDNGSDTCILFEGFLDYLSWLVLGLGCGDDYLVLNSVALLERSFASLDRYERIMCYLDRDEAGRRALESLRGRYGNKVEDCSALYKGFKDLNEYLQHRDDILK